MVTGMVRQQEHEIAGHIAVARLFSPKRRRAASVLYKCEVLESHRPSLGYTLL